MTSWFHASSDDAILIGEEKQRKQKEDEEGKHGNIKALERIWEFDALRFADEIPSCLSSPNP